jgi:hypothetical protein
MLASIALAFALVTPTFHSSTQALPAPVRSEVVSSGNWYAGCPVPLSSLRLLTLSYWGFDAKVHTGQLVVNVNATAKLSSVFAKLYAMHFPIRDMALVDTYGPAQDIPPGDDVTASFECRQAAASPCVGGRTGAWSEHAYGEAVDLNPLENPYVGCGQTRDKLAVSYMNRSNVRPGMVNPAVVAAFGSVGWGWGGSWFGSTKDYMHFSATGH